MDAYEFKLKEFMLRQGINRTKLAELSGVSRPYISQMLSGKHIPRVDIVCKLCIALECSLSELIQINMIE